MADKKLYEVTVEGQYFTGDKKLRRYVEKFTLVSMDRALSVIKKSLLHPRLAQKYDDYKTYRTHRITETRVLGTAPNQKVLSIPLESMSFEQLSDFAVLRGLMVDPYKYSTIVQAREAVGKAWADEQVRLTVKAEKAEAESEAVELRKLNNIPDEDQAPRIIAEGGNVLPPFEKDDPNGKVGTTSGAGANAMDDLG